MLEITIPATELWDERKSEFISVKEQKLQLEHSLVSLSKWESKYGKPFLSRDDKTYEETLDYIKFMTLTQNVKPDVYVCLTDENIRQVNDYIGNPMTATTFPQESGRKGNQGEIVTAEVIYYWMVALEIPIKCEKWHLNRLTTLIRVINAKNAPQKNMSKKSVMSQNAALNAARRKRHNSRG